MQAKKTIKQCQIKVMKLGNQKKNPKKLINMSAFLFGTLEYLHLEPKPAVSLGELNRFIIF